MSQSNLTKSEAGWVRLRARVAAREGVRAAKGTDYRPRPKEQRKAVAQVPVDDNGQPFIVRKGRKRRRAFVAHNGRSE